MNELNYLFLISHTKASNFPFFEQKYERAYGVLQSLTTDLSEKEAHDALTSAVCKDAKTHEDVSFGLVYVILTEPQNATRVSTINYLYFVYY